MAKANCDARKNISVFVRVRPTLSSDTFSRSVLEFPSENEVTVKDNVKGKISDRVTKKFYFNRVFNQKASQVEVYEHVVQPLLEEVLQGYSCTVFAYGQTGTGKTFTMEGERSTDNKSSWGSDPNAGIIPRTLSELFDKLRLGDANYAVRISFLELYNEELVDLLSAPEDTTKLRLFEDSTKKGAVIISGLEEVEVCTKADVYKILEKGSLKRQTASTLMNAHSSRSHTVFTATVYIREKAENDDGQDVLRTGKINLVDLAGSENIGRSGAVEKRAREAGNINQSLLTLGRVITALVDQSPHVPYRESKLTRLLQESLGGRTKTSIIATVSPTVSNYEETLSTLEYAHRAKNIQNKPEINQRLSKKLHLAEYTEEIERLHRDLEATRQRTGVFLHQSEYDELLRQLDSLNQESVEKVEQIKALNEEKDKQETMCNELSKKLEVVGTALEEEEAALAAKKSTLLELQSNLEKTRCEEREQTHLVARHWETAQKLKRQATELRSVAELSSTKLTLLHDKLKHVRSNAASNEKLAMNMHIQVCESMDLGVELVEASAKESLDEISAVKTRLRSGLKEFQDTCKVRKEYVSSLVAIDSCREVAAEQSSRQVAWAAEFGDVVMKGKQSACALDSWLTEVSMPSLMKGREQMIKLEADIKNLISKTFEVDAWREKFRLAAVDDISQMLSAVEERVPTLKQELGEFENVKVNTLMLKEKHCIFSKNLRGQISNMKKSVESMRALSEDWREVAEAKRACVADGVSKYSSGAAALNNSMDNLLTQGNAELVRNKEHYTKQIIKLCEECCNAINEWDTSNQLGDLASSTQNVLESGRAAWRAQNATTIRLIEEASQEREKTSSMLNERLEELETLIEGCVTKNRESLDEISSNLSALTVDVESLTSKYHGNVETWTESLKKIVMECSDKVDCFVNGDYQETVSTGQTPQRGNVNYPRDLPTTSPHERILGRFRQKMLQTTAAEESPESISPSSLPVVDYSSEIDNRVRDKENNDSIKESPLKEKKPRSRKPLVSQNGVGH